jgi:hypothetical protein
MKVGAMIDFDFEFDKHSELLDLIDAILNLKHSFELTDFIFTFHEEAGEQC